MELLPFFAKQIIFYLTKENHDHEIVHRIQMQFFFFSNAHHIQIVVQQQIYFWVWKSVQRTQVVLLKTELIRFFPYGICMQIYSN